MEQRVSNIEKNLEGLSQELSDLKNLLISGLTKVDNNFELIRKDLDTLHKKVDTNSTKIDALKGETSDGFSDVGVKLENLTDEISKISKVTGYDDAFNNLSGFSK